MSTNKYVWLGLTAAMMFMVGALIAEACNENNYIYLYIAVGSLAIHINNLFTARREIRYKQNKRVSK